MDAPAWLPNAHRRAGAVPAAGAGADVRAFHRSMPGYQPTPLVALPEVAADLGLNAVLVKDESSRLGLPAFKMLGASWAVGRAVASRERQAPPADLGALRELVGNSPPVHLVTATDGNHGRAVARMGALLGLPVTVVVPRGVSPVAVALIRDEGCRVEVLDASYDEAVRHAAELADGDRTALLVQDTSWPGYADVPRWIVDGYATLFDECAEQAAAAALAFGAMIVPTGVGSLAHAAVRFAATSDACAVVAVEPDVADCLKQSLAAGRLRSVPTGQTAMAGLNCGTPSYLAWPDLEAGLAGAVTVSDDAAARAAEVFAVAGVDSGPCGAASLAALRVLASDPAAYSELGLGADAAVLLLNTEGARED